MNLAVVRCMMLARFVDIGRVFPVAAVGVFLASCAGEPASEVAVLENETPAIEQAVKVLATGSAGAIENAVQPASAQIVDVIDGGPGGVWGVKVDFPSGTGEGCYVDVVEKRSGDLLARDEVDSPDKGTAHLVQFRYRGPVENLAIRVTEKGSGAVLAESEHR